MLLASKPCDHHKLVGRPLTSRFSKKLPKPRLPDGKSAKSKASVMLRLKRVYIYMFIERKSTMIDEIVGV
jgi:hypothetical protein